jgi:carbon-monoxide dehydrogenase small subunit
LSIEVRFRLNGKAVKAEAHPGSTLLDVLKHELGIVSVKRGCETGECGACTVLFDGALVNSCLVLASKVEGRGVMTLEGLLDDPLMSDLQARFVEENAFQCGFCTPGILMSLYALLLENRRPSAEEVERAIEGNLCRCGAYLEIRNAALAAKRRRHRRSQA